MPQTFHTFRAPTLDQAYAQMRRRFGDEAIVVRTATVPDGGLLGRLLGKTSVEITASIDETLFRPPADATRPLSNAERRYRDVGGPAPAPRQTGPSRPGHAQPELGSDARVRETIAYFRELAKANQRHADAQKSNPRPDAAQPEKTPAPAADAQKSSAPSGKPTPPMEQANTAPAEVFRLEPVSKPKQSPMTVDEIRGDLSEMREMLNVLSAEMPGAGLPQEFVPQYQLLLKQGVARKRAASLVQQAARRGDLRAFRDTRIFLERLKMELRRDIKVTGGIALQAGVRKIVALVGATGVGKTTNLAKLAALYAVQEHAKVGVITTDTYRVAATDQLQVYANIIDLPMEVVHEPSEMKAALKKLAHCDLVLIDTAGGSPFNREQMTDMRSLLDVAQPDEVHLLASANTSLEDLRDVVTHFSLLRPSALFFTKLDETKRYGQLYCLAVEAGLPLSYFSVGQQVPDDIMPASPGTVAKLVIEGEDGG